jgi:hypothetical protein
MPQAAKSSVIMRIPWPIARTFSTESVVPVVPMMLLTALVR